MADFTSFDKATAAEAKLRSLGGSVASVDNDLKTFGSQFSGANVSGHMLDLEKATRQADVAAGGLTARMVTLGSAVGSFIGNFAANAIIQGATALVSMGKAAFEGASNILDLSNKTGLATDTIQRMQFVADQTGGTLDQFTAAAFQLSLRLATGSGSVREAVDRLGLSYTQLKALRPDEQFEATIDKLGEVENATTRNELGVALYGRNFANIAAAVAQGYGDIAKAATVSTDEQLEALDKSADAWDRFYENAKTSMRSTMGEIVLFAQRQKDFLFPVVDEHGVKIMKLGDIHLEAAAKIAPTAAALETYANALAKAQREIGTLTTAQRAEIEAATKLGVATSELADRFGVSEVSLRLYTAQQTKAREETDKHTAAVEKQAGAYRALMSEMGNANQKAIMDAAAAGLARQAQMRTELWMMERDAFQISVAEGAKKRAAEAAANEALTAEIAEVDAQIKAYHDSFSRASAATVDGAAKMADGFRSLTREIQGAVDGMLQLTAPTISAHQQAVGHPSVLNLGLGPRPLEAHQQVTNITVQAQGAFFDTPASLQSLADRVGAAVLARGRL